MKIQFSQVTRTEGQYKWNEDGCEQRETKETLFKSLIKCINNKIEQNPIKIYIGKSTGQENLNRRKKTHQIKKYDEFIVICTSHSETLQDEIETYLNNYIRTKFPHLSGNSKDNGDEGRLQKTIQNPVRYNYLCCQNKM